MIYDLNKLNIAFEAMKAIENAFVEPKGKIVGTSKRGFFVGKLTLICENEGYIFRDNEKPKYGCCGYSPTRFEAVRKHLSHGEAWLET